MLKFLLSLIDSGNGQYITDLNNIQLESWMPVWVLPFLFAMATGASFYGYSKIDRFTRKQFWTLSVLRSLAYCSIIFLIALPVLKIQGEGTPAGPLPVIVDGSESMSINDINGNTRTSEAFKIAEEISEASDGEDEIKLTPIWAGTEFGEVDIETLKGKKPNKDYTSLSQIVDSGIRPYLGDYSPGMILISDGGHNTTDVVDPVIDSLAKRGIPIYTVGLGEEKSNDVAISNTIGEDVIFKDEKAKMYLNILQDGYKGKKIRVSIKLGVNEVYKKEHELKKDGLNSIPIEYKPRKAGQFQMKVSVKPLKGEVTEENNTYLKNVRVIDKQIRVLMVFGTPSWEFRYLAGAFERDKRVDFKAYLRDVDSRIFGTEDESGHFIREIPSKYSEMIADKESGTENARTKLGQDFDIVFFSRVNVKQLDPKFVKAVAQFVKNGGAMAVISDPYDIPYSMKDTPLENLLPVTVPKSSARTYKDEILSPLKDPLKFETTEDGGANQLVLFSGDKEENDKIWGDFPPQYRCYTDGRLKAGSISLLVTFTNTSKQKYPAIVHQSYGQGTVLFMGFDSTWRWRKEFGDRFFRDFWGKAVQFMGLHHLLKEHAQSIIFIGKENSFVGEKVNIRAKVSNADYSPCMANFIKLRIDENGKESIVKMMPISKRPGMYKSFYTPQTRGELNISLAESKFSAEPVKIRINKRNIEFKDSGQNRKLLEDIALKTGGKYFHYKEAEKLYEEFMNNRPKIILESSVSLWDSVLLLILVAALFSAEWVYRKLYYID